MPLARADARDRTAQVKRVLIGLLVANLGVVGAKFVIGMRSGSLAVLSDAIHSTVDAANNILALSLVVVAARAPDAEHPYGHSKFETVGALAIVVFLSISAFELVRGAAGRLGEGVSHSTVTAAQLGVLVSTLAVNIVVARYEAARGRALGSQLLIADAAHTKADVFITVGVLAGVVAARAGYPHADPIVALVVAGAIVVVAWDIIRHAVPVLVDQHAVPAKDIKSHAEAVTGVRQAYAIRSRGAPARRFAELTVSVDGGATVTAGHAIADAVESRLRENLQLHEIVVHVEPC